MNLTKVFFIIALAGILASCGPSEKQLAVNKLQVAQNLYAKGDTSQALQQLDSIRFIYKGAIQANVEANKMKKKIYGDLLFNRQDQLDSLAKRIKVLEKKFVKEKTAFDQDTQYVYKRQQFKTRWNKSFIQVYLDQKGSLYISSNYHGDKWLNHIGIRVYDGDLQAKTDTVPLGSVLNHHSDFLDTKWEKVTYMNGADNGVIDFIAKYADRKLKAVFLGSRYYYIILEKYDKQAVANALALSKALKEKARLKKEIKSLQSKVG